MKIENSIAYTRVYKFAQDATRDIIQNRNANAHIITELMESYLRKMAAEAYTEGYHTSLTEARNKLCDINEDIGELMNLIAEHNDD